MRGFDHGHVQTRRVTNGEEMAEFRESSFNMTRGGNEDIEGGL